ncbi:RAMP superfamily CRISPR-associated protein [Anaerocellum danielii]|uniref:RAMP superfamily CRISPR-associated protein n=1 Tax=Anaerocellum danielii TaxID=1387557 RepID=A0ABZ0TZS9_9FIRM|nr:RAMP superfamily CRISPR-associated protein [Caldicellulosiruptor danielii]WPX08964.1 RAMP superfamily CRISPR-associated protein [Caldicellulosiruptor danielii]
MSKIVSKIVVKGILKNISPFLIGKGKGDLIDIEVLKDEKGKPFIPASSFVGALRHYMEEKYSIENKNTWDQFWGSYIQEQDSAIQSHFVVSDMYLKSEDVQGEIIDIRDGIKIDLKFGVAKEGAKYDYEIVNQNLEFDFNAEIVIREGFDREYFLRILKTLLYELEQGNVRIGAFTTKGFGKFILEGCNVYEFSFLEDEKRDRAKKYFSYLENGKLDSHDDLKINMNGIRTLPPKGNKDFEIDAVFFLKNSLLIGSSYVDVKEVEKFKSEPNKIHIRYNQKPVVPGSSLKGALRARAYKIVKTLLPESGPEGTELIEALINNIFGYVTEKSETEDRDEKKTKCRGRISVEECILEGVEEANQTRIKIDRFTGGTITGALFVSRPVWHKDEKLNIRIKVKDPEEWEIGLLLLVLKDIWCEDLPFGGDKAIGRGILKGHKAQLKYQDKLYKLSQVDNGKIKIEGNKEDLEYYVKKFLEKIGV